MAPAIVLRSPLLNEEEDAFLPSATPSPDTSLEDAPEPSTRSDSSSSRRENDRAAARTASIDQQYWASRRRSQRHSGNIEEFNYAAQNTRAEHQIATNRKSLTGDDNKSEPQNYSFERSPSESFEIDELNSTPENGHYYSSPSNRHHHAKQSWSVSRFQVLIGIVFSFFVVMGISAYFHEPLTKGIGHAWSTSSQLFKDSKMESCGMCASSPETCGKYGREALELSRSYTGTGARLRRVMEKAERGEKVTVGILGGSVSEGIGVPANRRWHEIVAGWFNTTFPHNEVELVNGAVPGRGTEYFMSCHMEHITPEADIVLIELGINDWHSGNPYDEYVTVCIINSKVVQTLDA